MGTWYYISPEQDRQEQYGKEVDIYALGITYFEMNCPFHTEMERHKVTYNFTFLYHNYNLIYI